MKEKQFSQTSKLRVCNKLKINAKTNWYCELTFWFWAYTMLYCNGDIALLAYNFMSTLWFKILLYLPMYSTCRNKVKFQLFSSKSIIKSIQYHILIKYFTLRTNWVILDSIPHYFQCMTTKKCLKRLNQRY